MPNISSYVKSIATFAPTFYGYIISVLASVHGFKVCGQKMFELLKIHFFTFQIASSPIRQEVDDDYEDIYQRLGKGGVISESKIWITTIKIKILGSIKDNMTGAM